MSFNAFTSAPLLLCSFLSPVTCHLSLSLSFSVSLAGRDAVKLRNRELTRASPPLYTRWAMSRPPGRIGPILSSAPNQWGNRLAERAATFATLAVTPEERRELETWLVSRFV